MEIIKQVKTPGEFFTKEDLDMLNSLIKLAMSTKGNVAFGFANEEAKEIAKDLFSTEYKSDGSQIHTLRGQAHGFDFVYKQNSDDASYKCDHSAYFYSMNDAYAPLRGIKLSLIIFFGTKKFNDLNLAISSSVDCICMGAKNHGQLICVY